MRNQPQGPTAPPYGDQCHKPHCTNKTDLVFMRVLNKKTGLREVGSFSGHTGKPSYGYVSNGVICMNEQFDYLGWVELCGNCYQLDLKANGKRAVDFCRKVAKQKADKPS